MFTREFDVRWSDLDANRHMANSAYQNFMSHTRMAYLIENGFTQRELAAYNLGPVIFSEQIYYFREIHQGKPITVTCEITGISDDGSLFSFRHDFYDVKGRNLARGIMTGAWMDLKDRKIIPLHKDLLSSFNQLPKADDFKVIVPEQTRAHGQFPIDR